MTTAVPDVYVGKGVYADISLPAAQGVRWAQRVVVKSVYAAQNGVDEQRLPHNVVLESRILTECSHPNIIELLEYNFDSAISLHRLTLPLLPLSLADLVISYQHAEVIARSIAYQCLSALSYLHSRGIGHRDVNPKNIMLSWDGAVKLIDFSTAYAPSVYGTGEGERGMVCQVGTGTYRAPELLFGSVDYDPHAIDIWSLGVVLAELFLAPDVEPDSGSETGSVGSSDPLLESVNRLSAKDFSSTEAAHVDRGRMPRCTLFNNSFGDIGLAASIFRLRGSPSYSWPEFANLPDGGKVQFEDFLPRPLCSVLADEAGDELVHLLEDMMALSPARRPVAEETLKYSWFNDNVLVSTSYPVSPCTTTSVDGQTLSTILQEPMASAKVSLGSLARGEDGTWGT